MIKQKNGKAFDKIKAGLDEARAYLDGSIDKREFGVHESTDVPPSTQARPPEDAK